MRNINNKKDLEDTIESDDEEEESGTTIDYVIYMAFERGIVTLEK